MVNNQIKLAYMKLQATFQALYGISTPSLTQEQIYTNFISTADVLPLQLIGQSNNLRIDRQRAEASIRNGVETLWWNLGSLRVQKNLTEDYALLVKAQLNLTEVQYKLGKASQLDLDMKKLELETARSNDRRMEREIENLELRLRDLAGLEYAEDFSVSITAYNTASVTLLSYEDYMRLALRTRVDAIRALQTIDVIRQEENIMSAYITDAANAKRREVRLRRLEAEQAYNKLIRSLDAEIYGVYDGAVSAKENLDTMQLRFFLAKKDLARLKALFDQGYLSAINYEGAKLSLTQAEINYENAQYQFNLKIQQLNHIVTYGGSTGGGA
jgi:outer membrane protein TolC